jgi:hypothetical protein
MSDEFPWISVYNYCEWSPAVLKDPNGESATHFVDEDGKTLAKTQDGNSATVTISNANKESFVKEHTSAKADGSQNSIMKNESWIRRFGASMEFNDNESVSSWALTAMGVGNNTLRPAIMAGSGTFLSNNADAILKSRRVMSTAPYQSKNIVPKTLIVRMPTGNIEITRSALKNVSTGLKLGGGLFGLYNAYNTWESFSAGRIDGSQLVKGPIRNSLNLN